MLAKMWRNWNTCTLLVGIYNENKMVEYKTKENSMAARRSNQSILRDSNPEYSLGGLMLKLKLQCFGHLMQADDSLEKSLILRKTEGRRKRGY